MAEVDERTLESLIVCLIFFIFFVVIFLILVPFRLFIYDLAITMVLFMVYLPAFSVYITTRNRDWLIVMIFITPIVLVGFLHIYFFPDVIYNFLLNNVTNGNEVAARKLGLLLFPATYVGFIGVYNYFLVRFLERLEKRRRRKTRRRETDRGGWFGKSRMDSRFILLTYYVLFGAISLLLIAFNNYILEHLYLLFLIAIIFLGYAPLIATYISTIDRDASFAVKMLIAIIYLTPICALPYLYLLYSKYEIKTIGIWGFYLFYLLFLFLYISLSRKIIKRLKEWEKRIYNDEKI